jgi:hypothetical protein
VVDGNTPAWIDSRDFVAHLYPLRRADVNVRVLDGETVVLDRSLRRVHQLNATASLVWAHCDGRSGVKDIATRLVREFDVDRTTAERDAADAVRQLAQAGLLQERPHPSLATDTVQGE